MSARTANPEFAAAAVAAANAIADDIEAGVGVKHGPAFSLAFGDAGASLLFDALARAGCRPSGELCARDLLRSAMRRVAGADSGSSLYAGWPGVALATSIICEPDVARQSLTGAIKVLRRGVSTGPWRGPLDLADGLVGLGVLALASLPDANAAAAAATVVQRLDELAQPLGTGVIWRTPDAPGIVKVGVAHGIAGIVLLLADAYEAGVEQTRAERLLDGAVEWLLRLAPADDGRRFPALVFGAPGTGSTQPNAWCWGDVGVALAIARAAHVRARDDWRDAAVDAALAAAWRDPSELGVGDACFCHGSAGIAHVLHALQAVTGDRRLADPHDLWSRRVLAAHAPGEGVGGFATAAYPWRPDTDRVAYPGLQLGAAGVGLTLLGACGLGRTGWDRAFLIPGIG